MNYKELKVRLEELRNELSELGLEPIADIIEDASFELDMAENEELIK
jgi:hypothetical protein